MDTDYLSEERLRELQAELDLLRTKKRLEVADQLKRAKEYGDLSENSEYAEAREEQSRVESRIFELEDLLKKAVVISKTMGTDRVQVGSKVTVGKGGKEFVYLIVGSNESKPEEGKISNESPLGRSFLKARVGDEVLAITPSGKVTYRILKIE